MRAARASCDFHLNDAKADHHRTRSSHSRMIIVRALEGVLAIPAAVSVVYYAVASVLLKRWQDAPSPCGNADDALPPVTFFRPLKAGVPDLEKKLASLMESALPGDQILIGVEPHSAEADIAEHFCEVFPEIEVVVVYCDRSDDGNPKVAKLLRMELRARHEHWILSDSELMPDPDFFTSFRHEWMGCDVLTAGYRFTRSESWPQRLDAAAVLLGLWPGLAVLTAAGKLRLTLGACTGFRRLDLQAAGGWAAFADDLAEDNRLGQALAGAGRTIQLSKHIVSLECDALSWRDYWRHQRRVAVTYRAGSPAGFGGAFLTQGVATGFLLVCWQPSCPWAWALWLAALTARCVTALRASRQLQFQIPQLVPVVLLASFIEAICWALSWVTSRVWWSGKFRRVSFRGRLIDS